MGNFFEDVGRAISKAAEQGEDVAKHVVKQLWENPEIVALGPAGLAFTAARNLREGRSLFGRRGDRPHTTRQPPPMPGGAYGPGRLAGLLGVAMGQGKTIAGTQPYSVTSYFGMASATAITENGNIASMFATANCTAFSVDDTFPWPFQSYRMRWNYTSILGILTTTAATILASVGDPAWIATLHAVFSNATEIARVALNNLGLQITLLGAQGFVATTGQAYGVTIETTPGVLWPVYYEKNGTYTMQVRSDHPVGTSFHPLQLSCQLDGWVINDPNILNSGESQIQATIDELLDASYLDGNELSIRRK